jgi:pimeloyl-ACP methyl ester carboxylesterase
MRIALLLAAALATTVAAPSIAKPVVAAVAAPTRFEVTVTGKGPDVLLIPGLASSGRVWDATVAALKAHYRLHVIQVAGFAGTAPRGNASGPLVAPLVEQIAAYISSAKLVRPAVIGHSMGGLSALLLAADHGDRVGKVMIVDALPWYGLLFGPTATLEGVTPQATAARDGMIKGGQAAYAVAAPRSMARLVKSDNAEAKAALAASASSQVDVVAVGFYDVMTTDARARLAGIKTPVTVVYAYDPVMGVPQAAMDALWQGAYAALPSKSVTRIDGSFHFIMIDQQMAFLKAVNAFLAP